MTFTALTTWENILKANKLPSIKSFHKQIDLSQDMTIFDEGKPNLEQIITILDFIERLEQEDVLILPEGFLYNLNARTVRKNIQSLKLKRISTKHEAISQEITPQKLIKNEIEFLRSYFKKNPESLGKDYGGINYRGITDKKNKTYLISDAIEGYLHAKNAERLIQIKRYDTLEMLLKSKSAKSLSLQERAEIKRAILKIRNRKMMIPEKARQIILSGKAERIVKIPSTSEQDKFYEMRFRRLPVSYSEQNKEFYATWQDTWLEPCCNCKDKMWYIKYINVAGEIIHCIHEIAAYRALINADWKNWKPVTSPNPYIATSPFFKPSKKTIDFYMRLRNQVFATKEGRHEHLAKIYIDSLIVKQASRGKFELM